jgi:hypothetical protein
MVLAQLMKAANGEYKWNILEDDNTLDVIEIQTWKGTYTIPRPGNYTDTYSFNYGCPYWFVLNFGGDVHLMYLPSLKQWLITLEWSIVCEELVQADTLKWVLAQPPQLDQMKAAYEEDREGVEKEFTEIETQCVQNEK